MATTRARVGAASFLVIALLVAFGLAAFASPFASSKPDGLNKVAADQGFDVAARDSATADTPLAEYSVTSVGNESVTKGVAGIIGVAITLIVATVVVGALRRVVRLRSVPRVSPRGRV